MRDTLSAMGFSQSQIDTAVARVCIFLYLCSLFVYLFLHYAVCRCRIGN